MTVLRPVLVGLGVGAVIAFVIALLSPRRVRLRVALASGPDTDTDTTP